MVSKAPALALFQWDFGTGDLIQQAPHEVYDRDTQNVYADFLSGVDHACSVDRTRCLSMCRFEPEPFVSVVCDKLLDDSSVGVCQRILVARSDKPPRCLLAKIPRAKETNARSRSHFFALRDCGCDRQRTPLYTGDWASKNFRQAEYRYLAVGLTAMATLVSAYALYPLVGQLLRWGYFEEWSLGAFSDGEDVRAGHSLFGKQPLYLVAAQDHIYFRLGRPWRALVPTLVWNRMHCRSFLG